MEKDTAPCLSFLCYDIYPYHGAFRSQGSKGQGGLLSQRPGIQRSIHRLCRSQAQEGISFKE